MTIRYETNGAQFAAIIPRKDESGLTDIVYANRHGKVYLTWNGKGIPCASSPVISSMAEFREFVNKRFA